jgi:hypothetical protein
MLFNQSKMINNSKNRFVVRLNLETHHLLPQSGYIYKKIQNKLQAVNASFGSNFFLYDFAEFHIMALEHLK